MRSLSSLSHIIYVCVCVCMHVHAISIHIKFSSVHSLSRVQLFAYKISTSQITADGDCSHEIKRCLLLGRKAMNNLDNILKSRDITLPTKVHLVNAMVFPVVMCG